jgi:FkbM family methyltransferase
MSRLFQIADRLDRIGLRGPVAKVATLVCPASRFSVDPQGRWINAQPEATFVSPALHTSRYAALRDWVLDNWLWDHQLRPGDTVIDVGAGIGEETAVFSRLVGESGRVIAIEAHPDTFSCLQRTVLLSGLDNVTAVQCAIADEDGELSISTADCHVASSVMTGGDLRVPARSLDSLAEELKLGRIAFVKMNIEGAERPAMRGMARLLTRLDAACISCHDFLADLGQSEDFRTKAEVRPALEAAGFAIRTRAEHPQSWVRDYLYARR